MFFEINQTKVKIHSVGRWGDAGCVHGWWWTLADEKAPGQNGVPFSVSFRRASPITVCSEGRRHPRFILAAAKAAWSYGRR